ncbi:MAG: EamA family transporter [Elusimicrobia bacterium]|nr:EamA family transporter [Elusimicrobiota bacterium]
MPKGPGFFIALTVVLWGAAGFIDKLTLRYLGPNETFVVRMGVNAAICLAIFFWGWPGVRPSATAGGKLPVLLIAASLVLTMAAVFCYIKALSSGEAMRIVPLSSTFPLVTFLLALAFLGETFSWVKLAGTVLICAGVGLLAI